MVRQAWLIAVVGVFLIGWVFLLVVGCSGETGSQPAGSQKSEVSQPAETGSEQTGSRESESTHEATELGGSPNTESTDEASGSSGFIRSGTGSPPFWLRFDGINYDTPYEEQPGRSLRNEDLGPKLAEVPYGNGGSEQSASPTTVVGAASEEVPVYAVEGYDPSFRLAARIEDRLIKFQAVHNPKANEAADILDIGGKVATISVTFWADPGQVFGTIGDSEEVERVVQDLMDARLKRTGNDYYLFADESRNRFLVVFHLEDGTAEGLEYRMDSGRLTNVFSYNGIEPASGIVAPKSFREAVDRALEGHLEYLEQQSPRKGEEQRQKRTCDDTRISKEARRINGFGEFYTTNDVYPGGPWGGVLRGTEENDKLADGNGEDDVYALGGDDTVEGGACDDEVYAGPGDDTVYGGDGSEVVYGGSGKDGLVGEDGDDVIYGGPGDDKGLTGYSGEDVLYGWYGSDVLNALDGERDELYCGEGRDTYYADKIDYVDSSCEVKKQPPSVSGGRTDAF